MDPVAGILVPLLAALLGAVAGGVLTYVAQSRLGNAQLGRERRAAARIVFFELVSNLAQMNTAAKGPIRGVVSESAWQARMATLADWLTPEELTKVHSAYMVLPGYTMANRDYPATRPPRPGYVRLIKQIEERTGPAIQVLSARGFTETERSRLSFAATDEVSDLTGPGAEDQSGERP